MKPFLQFVQEHIVKVGDKYRLLSHSGKNLGTFDSHAAAAKHEGEVEYFKTHEDVELARDLTTEGTRPTQQYTVTAVDPDGTIGKLLEHIRKAGNGGHSFSIVVDPGDSRFEQKFFWDGDGPDRIVDVTCRDVSNG